MTPQKKPKQLIERRSILLIILLGLLVYFPSFSVPFLWDDFGIIVHNPLIQQVRFLPELFKSGLYISEPGNNFYRPMQAVSNMFDFYLWRGSALGFHLTNILLHCLCAVLLFLLFSMLFDKKRVAFLSSLVFLVHPVNVEAVTYISGRADSLALLFLLLSFISYLKLRLKPSGRLWLYSILFFLSALLSKELALAGIFIFPLLDWIEKKKGDFKFYLPYLFLALFILAVRFSLIGIPNSKSQFTFQSGLLIFIASIFEYIRLLFAPFKLHMSYTLEVLTRPNAALLLKLVLLITFFVFLGQLLRREKKLFLFCLAWFFIFLIAQSGFFPINAFFAEHFIYLSEYALIFILLLGLFELLPAQAVKFYQLIFIPPLIVLSALNFSYQKVWQEPVKFYQHIISLSSGSFASYNNLGAEFEKQGLIEKARRSYLSAISVEPNHGLAYNNLAKSYLEEGQFQKAITLFEQGIQRGSANAAVYYNLGRAYRLSGDLRQSQEAYLKAQKICPWDYTINLELALVYRKMARVEDALRELKRAIALEPRQAQLYLDLGVLYKEQRFYGQAIDAYRVALKLNPRLPQAYNNLGVIYAQNGDFQNALLNLSRALSLDPGYQEARFNLGLSYIELGLYLKAEQEFAKIAKDASFYPEVRKQIERIARERKYKRKDAKN